MITPRPLLLLLLLLLPLGALLLASCSKEEPAKEIIRPVKAMQVGDVSNIDKAKLTGKAKATEEINIAFEVSGRIVELPVDVGTVVKQGQELARLDSRDYQNAVDVAQAETDRAEAQRDRIKKAFESNAVSAQDMTNAEAQARADAAALGIAKKQLEDTVIKAPFAGRIAAKYVDNYQNILAKQKVLRLIDVSKVEMIVDVPESLIPNVPFVESIEVTFTPFPDVKIPAKTKEVSSEASELTRTYPVTLIMEQPEGVEILPGMAGEATATAKLPPERLAEGITVVPSAVASSGSGGESFVWAVDEGSGVVSKTPVQVGRFTQYGVVITGGLEPGQWIVTAGVHSLIEGQKVYILEQE
jgi:RND family efflux transporter MFP subunit